MEWEGKEQKRRKVFLKISKKENESTEVQTLGVIRIQL